MSSATFCTAVHGLLKSSKEPEDTQLLRSAAQGLFVQVSWTVLFFSALTGQIGMSGTRKLLVFFLSPFWVCVCAGVLDIATGSLNEIHMVLTQLFVLV